MLNEYGFTRKTYDDLLESMENKAKELFGENVRTTSTSVIGILIRIFAWSLSLLYELLEKVYFNSFINSATGISLDRLAANYLLFRSPASAAIVELEFEGQPGYVIDEGMQVATEDIVVFQMIDVVTLDSEGKGRGQAVSLEYSDLSNVPANTITLFLEPTEELISVNNPTSASGGSVSETDKSLRDRIKASISSSPGPPVNGIISSVLGVPGVRMARVIENNTMTTDSFGNPPKTIHVYALGGQKELIGQAIFDAKAAGIQTYGNEIVEAKDMGGFSQTVYFDYASSIRIYVRIRIETTSIFPVDGVQKIKDSILDYINNITMGGTIRYSYLYPQIYAIPGVNVATVEIGKSTSTLQATDIGLSPFEAPVIVANDIEVIRL